MSRRMRASISSLLADAHGATRASRPASAARRRTADHCLWDICISSRRKGVRVPVRVDGRWGTALHRPRRKSVFYRAAPRAASLSRRVGQRADADLLEEDDIARVVILQADVPDRWPFRLSARLEPLAGFRHVLAVGVEGGQALA